MVWLLIERLRLTGSIGIIGTVCVVVGGVLLLRHQAQHIQQVGLNFAAAQLTNLVSSQLLEVVEGARNLVCSQALAAVILQPIRVQSGACPQNHTGHDIFGAVLTRTPHDGALFHIRVLAQAILDLARVDVETTGDDHFLNAGNNAHEAIFFHHSHVTGAEPAIMEGVFRGFLIVQIAFENLRAAAEQLAFLTIRHGLFQIIRVGDAYLSIREWDTDIARTPVFRVRVTTQHWRGLGQAVAFHQQAAGALFPLLDGVFRQGGGTGNGVGDALKINVLLLGCLHNLGVQRRHARHPGWLAVFDDVHQQRDFWLRYQHHLATQRDRQAGD